MSQHAQTVREARDEFLKTWGFSLADYKASTFPLHIGRLIVRVPNVGVLHLHDLHHVATGYPSGFTGEAQICAYELRSGIGMWQVSPFVFGGLCIGFARCPRRVARAWRQARGTRNLYPERHRLDYEGLLNLPVSALRRYLGIPEAGYQLEEEVL